MTPRLALLIALFLCITSRLLSAIYYIEDPDSLRFALSTVDYDVTRLQPHFPAYPVFCGLLKLVTLLTGRYAVAFALVGGLSTWVLILCLLGLAQERLTNPKGLLLAGLVFLNPMFWLMGNRYMPDLAGLACLMAAFYYLTQSRKPGWGGFLTGLLAGIRLSYMPFMVLPWGCACWDIKNRWRIIRWTLLGTGVWLFPLIWITGWTELVQAAKTQSTGHFLDFGRTMFTEPDISTRIVKLVEAIVADGLGLLWRGRHISTAVAAVTLTVAVGPVLGRVLRREAVDPVFRIHLVSWTVYLLWIFFGQNVIYKSRHVMPLLPLILLIIVQAIFVYARANRIRRGALGLFLVAHTYVTTHLVVQHTRPSAIAQAKDYLQARATPSLHVVTVPLVEYYLSSQGISATYIIVEDPSDVADLSHIPPDAEVVTIGSPHPFPSRSLKSQKSFFHNPYVNRMWPEIEIYEY